MENGAPSSPRIERIVLDGVGPFDGATFEPLPPTGPGELVLFEGPNGSGKTTILEAIAVLVGSVGTSLTLEVATGSPMGSLRRRFRSDEARVAVEVAEGCAAVVEAKTHQGAVQQLGA